MARYEFEVDLGEVTDGESESLGFYDRLPTEDELDKAFRAHMAWYAEDVGEEYYAKLAGGAGKGLGPAVFDHEFRDGIGVSYMLGVYEVFGTVMKVSSEETQSWEDE